MDSMSYNFNMEDQKPIFSTANDTKATATTESFAPPESRRLNAQENSFSPLAAPFQGRADNELLTLLSQEEPRVADTAPSAADVDALNFRMGSSDLLFDDIDQNHNFYMGNSRAESMSSHSNLWSEGTGGVPAARNGEMIDTFDFLVKSLSSANNYVSMLTREQLFVLRSIRPGLLYEFLQEVAKVRGDKRMRRALPNECAFCKNNGENEECYTEHALKDWRGRVLCPVLRAFRCPRCGATGDHAHTIKYCRENGNAVSDRDQRSGLPSRRRGLPSMELNSVPLGLRMQQPGAPTGPTPTPTPTPSPSPATAAYTHSSLWSSFGMN